MYVRWKANIYYVEKKVSTRVLHNCMVNGVPFDMQIYLL